jgi:hypothetical protein
MLAQSTEKCPEVCHFIFTEYLFLVSCCILGRSLQNGPQNTPEDYKGSRDIFDERKSECTLMYNLDYRTKWMPHIDRTKVYGLLYNNDETCNRIHLNLLWKNLSHYSRSHELRTDP